MSFYHVDTRTFLKNLQSIMFLFGILALGVKFVSCSYLLVEIPDEVLTATNGNDSLAMSGDARANNHHESFFRQFVPNLDHSGDEERKNSLQSELKINAMPAFSKITKLLVMK